MAKHELGDMESLRAKLELRRARDDLLSRPHRPIQNHAVQLLASRERQVLRLQVRLERVRHLFVDFNLPLRVLVALKVRDPLRARRRVNVGEHGVGPLDSISQARR